MRTPCLLPSLIAASIILVSSPEAPCQEPVADSSAATAAALRSRQEHLRRLAGNSGPDSDREIIALLEQYRAGELPASLWLELFEAAASSTDSAVQAQLAEKNRADEQSRDLVKRFRECLEGGDAEAGRVIFLKKPEAGCVRCHRVGLEGGQIGPDLTALRQHTDRVFILESIIDPNTVITPGFPHVALKLRSGEAVSGVLTFESGELVTLTAITDGKRRNIPTAEITERAPLPSPMPAGFGVVLGKRAIRDLVEFLATLE